jgi:Zn-dependent M28 family amino/carboxypeptidase
MPGKSFRGELPPADEPLVALAMELRQDVTRLAVEIGERNVRNRPKQLAQAADCIAAQFNVAGYDVRRQEYTVEDTSCCNLEVEILGTTRHEEIVIVGAHYDTLPGTPGANDNTSGVAAVLALARRFAPQTTDRTLRFVAFVNEESPYAHTEQMGSRVYSRRCRERGESVVAMMSLETMGYYDDRPGSQKYPPPIGSLYPSEGNFIGFVGNLASGDLVCQVVQTFRESEPFPCEGAALPEAIARVGDSDHASFWHEGYPALMVTDTANFRYPFYHMPEDTIDKVNFDRLARVVRGLEKVVAELVGGG